MLSENKAVSKLERENKRLDPQPKDVVDRNDIPSLPIKTDTKDVLGKCPKCNADFMGPHNSRHAVRCSGGRRLYNDRCHL
jgi:hypothetical protein